MSCGVSSSLYDLTGNKIQETYQRIAQVIPNPTGSITPELYDGVGNKISGSFTGSFAGEGSGITGITTEWDGTHNGNAQITGSLVISGSNIDLIIKGGITGSSLQITDLTTTRVPYINTNGEFIDSSKLTYNDSIAQMEVTASFSITSSYINGGEF